MTAGCRAAVTAGRRAAVTAGRRAAVTAGSRAAVTGAQPLTGASAGASGMSAVSPAAAARRPAAIT